MNSSVFVVSGRPGCGKGGLIKLLFSQDQVISMSGGLVELRDNLDLGPFVREPMDSGNLVPTEITFPAFQCCWDKKKDSSQHIVLDGVIRTKIQAGLFLDLINASGYRIQQIILIAISVPLDVCAKRMKGRGRVDDQREEIIQRRFDVYRVFTAPAEDYLRAAGVTTVSINGNQTPDLVEIEARGKLRAVCPGF
jgi:adenylate kinase family enzyme